MNAVHTAVGRRMASPAVRRRLASGAAVVTAAAVALSVTAGGASAEKLPGGHKRTTGIDGQVVTLKRSGEYAFQQQSQANNSFGRSTRISGIYTARINRGGGNVQVGYLVGCQVNVGGLDVGISGGLYAPLTSPTSILPTVGGTLSLPVAPGQIQAVYVLDKNFYKKVVSIQLSGVELSVQGCAGYAQARSFVKVLAADQYNAANGTIGGSGGAIQTTLYGKPFSLG
ncbi:MspA family porin [Gordonia sp. X0973]|uniref:MspA family porin n=1 Tax=Gordonia sp. X0973 TaxID=2742602 RepID=UPI0026576358|nr:MspA family porin [Gordonia sp. X0973]